MFESIALFACRVVYRAALDHSDPSVVDEALSAAETTADLLDELALAARFAPPGIQIGLPPFGAGDTSSAPAHSAVAAASLRRHMREIRSASTSRARLLLVTPRAG
jgi:hypothetical protein